jgi:predicted nucleic acid-binding protein
VNVFLDSDILIDVSRGRDRDLIDRWLQISDSDMPLLCSPVSLAELWHGALPKEQRAIEAVFSAMIVVPIDAAVGRQAGEYLRRFAKSHGVQLGDALIAASAVKQGAALWTRNRRHYPMPNLRFYS